MKTPAQKAAAAQPAVLARIGQFNELVKKTYLGVMLAVVGLGLIFREAGSSMRHLFSVPLPLHNWRYDFPTFALTLLMLSAAVHTDVRDFRQLAQRPRVGAFTLIFVWGVVPLVTIAVSRALGLVSGDSAHVAQLQLGMIFIALMPVGLTAAMWVSVNMGNTPLLLSLITITTAVAVPLLPMVGPLLPGSNIGISASADIVRQLVLAVAVPTAVGIALRHYASRFVNRYAAVFALLGTIGLVLTVFGNVSAAAEDVSLGADFRPLLTTGVVTVALNAAFFALGVVAARRLNLVQEDAIALIFSSGMRNTSAAINICSVAFPTMPLVTVPAAVYALSQQVMGGYLTKSLLASGGGLLGPPIGADRSAMEARLERFYTLPYRRAPGLSLLVFRLSGTRTSALVNALVQLVPRVRRMVRGDDEVCFLPPDGFAVALESTTRANAKMVAEKIATSLKPHLGTLSLSYGLAHSDGCPDGEALLDAAETSAGTDEGGPDFGAAPASA